jgi:hypothetical protein
MAPFYARLVKKGCQSPLAGDDTSNLEDRSSVPVLPEDEE